MKIITIIGAGLAGLSAALTLAENGYHCRLVSQMPSERAQSVMAEGGINAALDTMGEDDTPQEHFLDTMKGGVWLADPNAVRGLCNNAPVIVSKLCDLGAALKMNGVSPVLRNFGGQKKKRTAYAKSSTGKILMTALIDEVRKYESKGLVERWSHHVLSDLSVKNGELFSAQVIDLRNGDIYDLKGSVILASGGMNSLFPGLTTGTALNTGDATAIAFYHGAEAANLEFIQYHPTTARIPGKRCLISEAARGEGGRLFVKRDGKPWYFMEEKYPELGNLMPRDVISREMASVIKEKDCGDKVYLDMTALDSSVWRGKLSDLRDECIELLAIDPMNEPVQVSPGIHYFMGGLYVDELHHTSINKLYAAGECACQYHGANRLGGNSMLGAIYGGKVAAMTAIGECIDENDQAEPKSGNDRPVYIKSGVQPEIAGLLGRSMGIFRNEKDMNDALKELDGIIDKEGSLLPKRRMMLAKAMLMSAINRKESRGAHSRSDYPEKNDMEYRKTSIAVFDGKAINITLREIPEERGDLT